MINATEILSQLPINIYVVAACLVIGWLMKKFLPMDNKIIPLTLVVLGAVFYVLLEGMGVQNAIIGAFTGAASTGLHQIAKQLFEGTKTTDTESVADESEV